MASGGRRSFWVLFATIVATVPFPLVGPFAGFVPPLRCALLSAATGLVAALEGAAGPVPAIFGLLVAHAIVGVLAALALASLGARLLRSLPAARRGLVLGLAVGLWLAIALLFDVYATPFGQAQRTGLLGLLS